MSKFFSGRAFSGGASVESWPLAKIEAALREKYAAAQELVEDGPIKVFGVEDNGVNFVVATMQTGPGSGKVVELAFLAKFVGFAIESAMVERINRNLHMSAASIEGGDLFLMAGLSVSGAFDKSEFAKLLEAWRRDLMVTLHGLSAGGASLAAMFPAAGLEVVQRFASNRAPNSADASPSDILTRFLGGDGAKIFCGACGGRGKRGFIARRCDQCEGTGFVEGR